MVENDSDDEDQWMAFSNNFITFTRVSYKEEIERWECIVKKDGYAVATAYPSFLTMHSHRSISSLYDTLVKVMKLLLKAIHWSSSSESFSTILVYFSICLSSSSASYSVSL